MRNGIEIIYLVTIRVLIGIVSVMRTYNLHGADLFIFFVSFIRHNEQHFMEVCV